LVVRLAVEELQLLLELLEEVAHRKDPCQLATQTLLTQVALSAQVRNKKVKKGH
jgi:hypothetical protein